jgi:hypothetical protein
MGAGWDNSNRFDNSVRSGNFSLFLENVLEREKGFYTKVVSSYAASPEITPAWVGRYENLLRILAALGETFNARGIVKLQRRRRFLPGKYRKFRPECTPTLREKILDSEQGFFDQLGKTLGYTREGWNQGA